MITQPPIKETMPDAAFKAAWRSLDALEKRFPAHLNLGTGTGRIGLAQTIVSNIVGAYLNRFPQPPIAQGEVAETLVQAAGILDTVKLEWQPTGDWTQHDEDVRKNITKALTYLNTMPRKFCSATEFSLQLFGFLCGNLSKINVNDCGDITKLVNKFMEQVNKNFRIEDKI